MNYIINPSWFYWIHLVEDLKTILICIAILGAVLSILTLCCLDDWTPDKEKKRMIKLAKISIIISLVCAIAFIFIPSKQTLIEMQVAKFATYENAEWTIDAIKSAVDYIVEAINSIK